MKENVNDMLAKKRQQAEELNQKRLAMISQSAIGLFNSMLNGETINVKVLITPGGLMIANKPTYGMISIHKAGNFFEMTQEPDRVPDKLKP